MNPRKRRFEDELLDAVLPGDTIDASLLAEIEPSDWSFDLPPLSADLVPLAHLLVHDAPGPVNHDFSVRIAAVGSKRSNSVRAAREQMEALSALMLEMTRAHGFSASQLDSASSAMLLDRAIELIESNLRCRRMNRLQVDMFFWVSETLPLADPMRFFGQPAQRLFETAAMRHPTDLKRFLDGVERYDVVLTPQVIAKFVRAVADQTEYHHCDAALLALRAAVAPCFGIDSKPRMDMAKAGLKLAVRFFDNDAERQAFDEPILALLHAPISKEVPELGACCVQLLIRGLFRTACATSAAAPRPSALADRFIGALLAEARDPARSVHPATTQAFAYRSLRESADGRIPAVAALRGRLLAALSEIGASQRYWPPGCNVEFARAALQSVATQHVAPQEKASIIGFLGALLEQYDDIGLIDSAVAAIVQAGETALPHARDLGTAARVVTMLEALGT